MSSSFSNSMGSSSVRVVVLLPWGGVVLVRVLLTESDEAALWLCSNKLEEPVDMLGAVNRRGKLTALSNRAIGLVFEIALMRVGKMDLLFNMLAPSVARLFATLW